MKALKCEACGADAGAAGVRCVPCHDATIRRLLASPTWMRFRGGARGDLPGETLADTLRRGLRATTKE